MIEYILNGKTVRVEPDHEQYFLSKNPSARKKSDVPGKSQEASQPQSNQQENTGSKSETGSSELVRKFTLNDKTVKVENKHVDYFLEKNPTAVEQEWKQGSFLDTWSKGFSEDETPNVPKDGGFFEDLIITWKGGGGAGDTVGEAFDVYRQGASISSEDLQAFIDAANNMNEHGPTQEQVLHQMKAKELGGGIFGTLAAFAYNPGYFPQMLTSSLATMIHSFKDSEETMASTVAGAAIGAPIGAGVGAALTAWGGPIAAIGGAIGWGTGAASGGIMGLVGAMETGLTLTDLLKDELESKGINPVDGFNEENIRDILEDKEAIDRIKARSLARGLTIGAVEGLTLGLSRGVGGALLKSGASGSRIALTTTATEMTGGFVGEVGGQLASGKEIDLGQATLEAVGETKGVFNSADIIAKVKGRQYELNGEPVTKSKILETINNKQMTTAEKAKILGNIDIKNDPNLKKIVDSQLNDVIIELQIDSKVIGIEDRKLLVELQKKKAQAEVDVEKKGVFKVIGAAAKLKRINEQIDEITTAYEDVHGNTKDSQLLKQDVKDVAESFAESNFRKLDSTIKFAKDNQQLIGKDVIVAESDVDSQAIHDMAREEHNSKIDDEIDNIRTDDSISEQEKNSKIESLENEKISIEDVAGADGFIVGDVIVINKDISSSTGQINVGAHELLHGVIGKHMKSLDEDAKNKLIKSFRSALTSKQEKWILERLQDRINEGENLNLKTTEEWFTVFSDGLTKGQITFDENVFSKIRLLLNDMLRVFDQYTGGRLGVKEFSDGQQVYSFMKDYQKSIKKGQLSKRAIKLADGGETITSTEFSKSQTLEEKVDVKEMSDAIDRHVPKDIATNKEFITPNKKTKLSPYDNVMQEILMNDRLDGYINKLVIADRDLGGITDRSEIVENVKFELLKKIRSEYKPIVDDNYRSLFSYIYGKATQKGRGGIAFKSLLNVKKDYVKRPDRGAASLEVKTSEGMQTRQIEDVTRESSIETEDLSIKEQAKQLRESKQREQKGLLEEKQTEKFVNKEYDHNKETNNKVEGVVKRSNYDVSKPYESVKEDMVAQENKNAQVSTDVNPTGILFDAFEAIAKNIFGVSAKAIMAKQQNLSKSENESGRKTIANRAKKEKSIKKYLEKILPDKNYNPKTKKAIGLGAGLIRSLYTDAVNENGKPIRIDNIRGRVLNLDKFTEAQLAEMFGLTPDYKLLPWKKGFKDGMIKGVVVAESVLTINQAARVASKQPAAPISIGKPNTMFSRSPGEYIKNSYRAATRDIAIEMERKLGSKFLMPGSTKNRPSQLNGVYDDKTGETWRQARDRVANNFVEENPRFRDMLMRGLIGGISRSVFGTVKEFNKKVKKAPKGVKVIEIKRHKYNSKKRQRKDIVKYLKSIAKNESIKLKHLKDFFLAIQNYIKKNPQDTWLFLEMLRDSTSAGMGSIIRILAPVKFYTVDQKTKKPILDQDMVEEHTDPQNQIGTALLYAAINGNVKEVFSVIGGSYMQGSILITEDNIINNVAKDPNKRSLKKDMPDIYFDGIIPRLKDGSLKLDDGMASVVRLATQGVNLNQLMLIDSDQTIAEYFGVGLDINNLNNAQIERLIPVQNELVVQILTGEITKSKAKKAITKLSKIKFKLNKKQIKASVDSKKAAINKTRMSKSPEPKGMSTFDFDDTLARTKSGVRATIPNKTNEPKPGRKVIFLAGGAGSGKGNVVKKLELEKQGFKIVNQDISLEWLKKNSGLPTDMSNLTKEQRSTLGKLGHQARGIARRKMMKYQGGGSGVVVDGSGASINNMQKLVDEFKSKGYDVSMVFVDTSLDVALERNRNRSERSLLDNIVIRNHESVQNNKDGFKDMFSDRFMEVNTDNITIDSPMPEDLTNKMEDFVFSYEKIRLDAEEFAADGGRILEEGGTFDFSEFNDVVEGTPGPLLNKAKNRASKFGTEDMFVLTARPQTSAPAIQQFLKSQGLDIPLKNITGLADSTGEAKAMWMLEKFAEGYNDMYFVDDALPNVKAVKGVLNQLDIKSEVVQTKTKFSKSASLDFNKILEQSKGINAGKVISQQEAKILGKNKGWWRIFVPPSAEDFRGLLYRFLGTGKQGDAHMAWFKEHLLDPFSKGVRAWNIYKQTLVGEYKELRKNFPDVSKSLNKKVPGTNFTADAAIRVYLWEKAGFNIPGLDDATKSKLLNYVNKNIDVKNFADVLSDITRAEGGYVKPSDNWGLERISTDLNNIVNKIGRKQFLSEYLENVKAIFTIDNMNKIEAFYGTGFRNALENILYRMENGSNRMVSPDRQVNKLYEWINGSIGAIMFINMRSALLQTISTVNFINWGDNNIFKAAAAFANQKQFWTDFVMLFNSPMLKQRRAGIQIDVSASELSKAFSDGRGTPQGVINWLLEKGFTPTQIADSFAIAFGGASMFRNRVKTYIKKGMTETEANEKAMLDFQEIAEETQQSSRPDLISQQQAGPLGRLILAFQNVTMQYTRLTKKALSDIINRRGDFKTNVSKLIYYGAVQNLIFGALQSALVFIMFGEDEEEKEEKTKRVFNGALDSLLRGTGIYGAAIATVKNTLLRYQKEKEKGWGRDDGRILLEILNYSPPIGSKLRKIYNALKTEQYNKGVSEEIGWRIENPTIRAISSLIEAVFNIPTERLQRKVNNLEEAITGNHLLWQRIALTLGWTTWDIGVKDEELEEAKAKAKSNRKEKNKEEKEQEKKDKGLKQVRCSATKSNGKRCGMTTWSKEKNWKCMHHSTFTDGMDRDGDGIKEYRCKATKSNGQRCKNKTENKNKRCYAHQ